MPLKLEISKSVVPDFHYRENASIHCARKMYLPTLTLYSIDNHFDALTTDSF